MNVGLGENLLSSQQGSSRNPDLVPFDTAPQQNQIFSQSNKFSVCQRMEMLAFQAIKIRSSTTLMTRTKEASLALAPKMNDLRMSFTLDGG